MWAEGRGRCGGGKRKLWRRDEVAVPERKRAEGKRLEGKRKLWRRRQICERGRETAEGKLGESESFCARVVKRGLLLREI